MKTSTFFIGLAVGTVAAAVTVLYSTPKSGSELRTSVKSASTDMRELLLDAKEKINDLKVSITKLTVEAKKTVPGAIDEIKESIVDWTEASEPNKQRMEKELFEIRTAIEKLEELITPQQK
ncbi:YtxH domain-containing protein [Sporosarcina sp. FA9]|uniref:YtxH domain-containing protein n=1 Tax=Sporosarcina sp. FA9 TaxID=3413030 RepID=UPI003F65E1FA